MNDGATTFGFTDWAVVGAYLAVVLGIGVVISRKERDTNEFFLAGRRIPFWAAGVSLLATSLSAVTFIGAPEASFRGNLTYLSLNIGVFVAVAVVALFFIPAFYRHNVTTVYELLGRRFGEPSRRMTSAAFMLGRVLASGARLYVAAIPVSWIVFGDLAPTHLVLAIAVCAACAAAYTMAGGIRAIIWTDTAQLVILLGAAAVSIVILVRALPMSASDAFAALSEARTPTGGSKSQLLDFRLDPALPFTVWSAIFGFSLFNMAAYGADQDLVQRLLTCRSAARGAASLVFATVLGMLVAGVFLVIGSLLFLHYGVEAAATPDPNGREVFLTFILQEIPAGLRGLMIAGLFAAAMSSTDSALGAMSSTAVSDFYRPMRPGRDERHYVRCARVAVILCAGALAAFAALCVFLQQRSGEGLLAFALGVMVYAYAGLLGVFLVALFTNRGGNAGVAAALLGGMLTVLVLHVAPWNTWLEPESHVKISLGWRMLAGTVVSTALCALQGPRREH